MSLHLYKGCRDVAASLPRGILCGIMTERGSEIPDQASAAPPAPSAPPTPSDPANNNSERDFDELKVEIDEELLIEEVKKFPILYEHAYEDYMESIEKITPWNKVCQSLFKKWMEYSPRKKKLAIKIVQNKWQKQSDTFYKSYNGVENSPKAKKPKINMDSLMFLAPPSDPSDVHDYACASTNTDESQMHIADEMPMMEVTQPELQIPLQPGPEIPHAHIPDIPPVPSTSDQVYGYARTYGVRQPVYIPMTETQSGNPNMHFARMLVPLLNRLSQEALYTAWLEILNTIKNVECPKRVQIIEQQLLYDPTQKTQENVEVPGVANADVPPEEPVQSEEEEAGQDRVIYPSSYGRPTNSEGEIMYPETDHEDLDEA